MFNKFSVPGTNAVAVKGKDGNASSCVIQVQQVWFNFAAPPRAPITRKIDYTRYVFINSINILYNCTCYLNRNSRH